MHNHLIVKNKHFLKKSFLKTFFKRVLFITDFKSQFKLKCQEREIFHFTKMSVNNKSKDKSY